MEWGETAQSAPSRNLVRIGTLNTTGSHPGNGV